MVTVNSADALQNLVGQLPDASGSVDASIKVLDESGTWHEGFRLVASQWNWWLMSMSETDAPAFYSSAEPADTAPNTMPGWAALDVDQVVAELLRLSDDPSRAGSR